MREVTIRRAAFAAALLPPIGCAVCIARYGFDAPYWDQWWQTPLIVKAFDGTLRIADLWTTINEHRVFVPNVIIVGLARLTHWDHRWEHGVTFLLAAALYVQLLIIARRACGGTFRHREWIIPLVSLLAFSFSQWEIWVWGLHLMMPLAAVLSVAAIQLLSSPGLGPGRLGFASVLAALATYTVGAGIAVWPAGLLILSLRPDFSRRHRATALAGWMGLAFVVMGIYFLGYDSTSANDSAVRAWRHPVRVAEYFLAWLGAPLGANSPVFSIATGSVLLVALATLARRSRRPTGQSALSRAELIGICVFTFGVDVMTTLKHWHEGPDQAIGSRYLIWPTLAWCVAAMALAMDTSLHSSRSRAVAVVTVTILLLFSHIVGAYRADEHHDAFLLGRRALMNDGSAEDLRWLYPNPEEVREFARLLRERRLSVFRD